MKKRIAAIVLCVLLAIGVFPTGTFAAQNNDDIIILYENDVHCVVEGYSKLAAMKKELQETHTYVGVVSCGDYIRGNSMGAVSQGEYIINLMNLVGYDAVALGNHEFGYRLPRLEELVVMMDTKPLCCNFRKIGEDKPYYEPYSIVSYGDVDVAYIGITTPTTIAQSFPDQFKDGNGEYIYTFGATELYDIVQNYIDCAKSEGADYVIALSHIGYAQDEAYKNLEDVEDLIKNTNGFDVVLDAHSHSVIEGKTVIDEGGNEVLLSSAGTKFEYIGKLVISDGNFKTELIRTEDYQKTEPAVDDYIEKIYAEYAVLGERKVGISEVDLTTQDENGNRLVRRAETNLGDLCAEAFRSAVGADIGYINGGGVRADIAAGDITFNDLLAVLPFGNTVVLAETDGRAIRDMMEMAMMTWPDENPNFPHVAGITFSVKADIPSSVVLNESGEFTGVDGEYRVYDIKVFNRESGEYEPLELDGKYTLTTHNYTLLECGGGMKMLENAVIIQNDGLLDVEALECYVVENLGGVVGEKYREAEPNITFTSSDACPDKDKSELYCDGAPSCIEEYLMQGDAEDEFAPDIMTTRAHFITMMWRMEGSPVVESAESYSDVHESDWYSDAVRWASECDIAEGYGGAIFAPDDVMTREQMAVVLWRYAKYREIDVSVGENTNILSYADVFDIDGYAVPAMQWACGVGLIQGTAKDNTMYIEPVGGMVLSQSAAMICRFCTEIMK